MQLVATAIGVGGLAASGFALAKEDPRPRMWLRILGGSLFAVLFLVDPPTWFASSVALVAALVFVNLLRQWRGLLTSRRRAAVDAAGLLALTLLLPALILIAALLTGSLDAAVTGLLLAVPPLPERVLPAIVFWVLLAVLLADGARVSRSPARALKWALSATIVCVCIFRATRVASLATLPMETGWSENPFLTNALKLDAHVPLYGDPELLNSYTYSPLLDLLHRVLLVPFGLQLSLLANRGLVLAEQVIAIALMVWSLAPHVVKRSDFCARLGLSIGLGALVLSSVVASAVHPDHPALMCLAVAWALLLREEVWPRWAWWTALILVTPLAASFKLSGAGIGVGLAAAFAIERRWRVVRVLALSGALSAATIPLFNASLGRYSFYALTVQSSHPIEWHRLADLVTGPFGRAAAALVVVLVVVRSTSTEPIAPTAAKRLAALTLGTFLFALPAYLKYAGRDNNLIAPFACFVAAVLIVAAHPRARVLHPLIVPASLLVSLAAICPPVLPVRGGARAQILREAGELAGIVRGAGTSLMLEHTSALIAADHREVPVDRGNSAIELFFARNVAACRLFEHIESGRYDRVVVGHDLLARRDDLLGKFNAELARSLAVYEVRTESASYVLFERPKKQQAIFRDCRP